MLQAEIESRLTLRESDILPQCHRHSYRQPSNFLLIFSYKYVIGISAYMAAGKFPTRVLNPDIFKTFFIQQMDVLHQQDILYIYIYIYIG